MFSTDMNSKIPDDPTTISWYSSAVTKCIKIKMHLERDKKNVREKCYEDIVLGSAHLRDWWVLCSTAPLYRLLLPVGSKAQKSTGDGALVALGIFPSTKYHIEAGPIRSIGIRAEKKVSIFFRCAMGESYHILSTINVVRVLAISIFLQRGHFARVLVRCSTHLDTVQMFVPFPANLLTSL